MILLSTILAGTITIVGGGGWWASGITHRLEDVEEKVDNLLIHRLSELDSFIKLAIRQVPFPAGYNAQGVPYVNAVNAILRGPMQAGFKVGEEDVLRVWSQLSQAEQALLKAGPPLPPLEKLPRE